jgi:FAD/FMN-containing dehydrogenase
VPNLSRREALRLLSGAAVAAALPGCTGSGSPASSTPAGGSTPPSAVDWAKLAAALDGPVLRPGDAAYPAASRLYDPRFDASSHPAAIARCASAADVATCVRFAAESQVPFAIRSGGHSYAGWSTSAGLVIDLRGMAAVAVDPVTHRATVGAGALLADVYAALAGRGAAIGAGSCPTVGVTGLTLGGGVGVLVRAFGLACDQLVAADVVTADGATRTVDQAHDPDLLWALRGGGGGSFGAVTALTFATTPAPEVQTFYLGWPFSAAAEVLDGWQRWVGGADRRLWTTCKLLVAPAQHNARALVAGTWLGPPVELSGQLAALRSAIVSAPTTSQATGRSYGDAMLFEAGCSGESATSCIDAALGPVQRQPFAATSSILSEQLPAGVVEHLVAAVVAGDHVAGLVEGGCSFDALGGAVADVAADASAFPYRRALATVQHTATWRSGSTDPQPFDSYVRGLRAVLTPTLGAAAYVNYLDPSIPDYPAAYWGSAYPMLQQVKRTVDPHELFTFPQAVRA